jgi:hypothetical protein
MHMTRSTLFVIAIATAVLTVSCSHSEAAQPVQLEPAEVVGSPVVPPASPMVPPPSAAPLMHPESLPTAPPPDTTKPRLEPRAAAGE